MKVYELMNMLAGMPSGADVLCSGSFTTKELESKENCGTNDDGEQIFSFSSDITDIDNIDIDIDEDGLGKVYINF